MSVDVANESGVAVDERGLVLLSRHVLDAMGIHPLAELSLLLVDVEAMEQLHVRWMGEPGPTDVLAFPMDELETARRSGPSGEDDEPAPTLLGDVVLCPEVAARQASTPDQPPGYTMTDELHLLCTHGILHLLGFDHGDAEEEKEMFSIQGALLDSWRAARLGEAPTGVAEPSA
ncbi:MAG: rRNA maturation RNase YbeY [Mycobacteriales bacterium]